MMKMAIRFQKTVLSAGTERELCFRTWRYRAFDHATIVLSGMVTIVLPVMRVAVDLYQISVGGCLKVFFKGC